MVKLLQEIALQTSTEIWGPEEWPRIVCTCQMAQCVSCSLSEARLPRAESCKEQGNMSYSRHSMWCKEDQHLGIQYSLELCHSSFFR